MGKYIDAKYLFKCNTCTHCRNGRCNTYCDHFECYTPYLNLIPTADVVEVRHGYWFITEYEYFTCSECGNSYYNGCESTAEAKQRMKDGFYNNYCGHCGAKMDGKDGAE